MKSFKDFIVEGNPLSRHAEFENKGRSYVTISATRKELTDDENKLRNKELEGKIKNLGYGYRKTKGMWQGGEEDSFAVYAHKPGSKHSKSLFNDMHALSTHYGQDSFLHHDGKTATLHGTNDSGFPGRGKTMGVGVNHYNRYNPDGMTKFYRQRKDADRPFLTATSKTRQPNRKPQLP